MFKIFVGTMYHQENDFEKCCDMINKQQNVIITHDIISNLSEAEAHKIQTQHWVEQKHNFDFFIKIDADTVLFDELILHKICSRMQQEHINYLQYGLFDFLSQTQIFGLNTFDTTVEFNLQINNLYCDRNFSKQNKNCVFDKIIVGDHMLYCNNLQAFHYGIHRGKKEQYHLIDKIKKANNINFDIRRLYALSGFDIAQSFVSSYDYCSSDLLTIFENLNYNKT